MAVIPGIIEGASQGKGLGIRFLRHIERNSILLFVIPATSEDIVAEYNTLLQELNLYNPSLLDKQRMIAISKVDILSESEKLELTSKIPVDLNYCVISAVTGFGIAELKDKLWESLNATLVG